MKYPNIIGREVEISTLERLYKSKKSEFIAIYGRRRIGKSYQCWTIILQTVELRFSNPSHINTVHINLVGNKSATFFGKWSLSSSTLFSVG